MQSVKPKPVSDSKALVGLVIDEKYRLERFVANGGMGSIFEARQLEPLQRTVAVKILNMDTDDPVARRRFFNEAALCASISHPNVVEVYDYGVTDERLCYIVMEYLHGEPLNRILKREKTLDPELALKIASDVCSALTEAHRAKFIHRDLKPSNLFIVDRQHRGLFVKVLDFGLAKRTNIDISLTQTGMFLGSPKYMAPEQVEGLEQGPATDIYNLGLVLYRMLTGRVPFDSELPSAIVVAQVTKSPPPFSEVAPALCAHPTVEWVVRTCLAKKPGNRFRDAHELARALEATRLILEGRLPAIELQLDNGHLVLPRHVELPSEFQASKVRPDLPSEMEEDGPRPVPVAPDLTIAEALGMVSGCVAMVAALLMGLHAFGA